MQRHESPAVRLIRVVHRCLAAVAVCLGLVLFAGRAQAGDPHLRWHTISTPHFQIHYHGGLAAQAQRAAQLAEQLQSHLVRWLGHSPTERTQIVLTDESDSANGFASVLPYSAIRLYMTAPDDLSALNDYDNWLPMLMGHEQTHIVHLDTISGVPAFFSTIIGKQFAPNQRQPHWLLEGLAVYAESQMSSAGRLRSSVFDMYMRADALEHHFATLDQITHLPRRWPGGNLWYLYGSKFVEFLAQTYGDGIFASMVADSGDDIIPFAVNRPFQRVTGITYPDAYAAFQQAAERRAQWQVAAVDQRGRREGRRLTHHGRETAAPRFVPPHCWSVLGLESPSIIYYRDDGHDAGALVTRAVSDAPSSEPTPLARSYGGSAAFLPDCSLVFQSSAPSQRLYFFNDLFLQAAGKRSFRGSEVGRSRLTTGRRARDPDVSHDGLHVVYVTNRAGTTTLQEADLTAEHNLVNEHVVFRSSPEQQVFTPRYSPNDQQIVWSTWTRGGYRDIQVYDRLSGVMTTLWHDRAIDQQPNFSPDGRYIVFSSDRTGISNIFAFDTRTRELKQVTNVHTGAFSPELSPDGRQLVYVGYTSAGYDLFIMDFRPDLWLPALPYAETRGDPVALDDRGYVPPTEYNPLPTLRPRALLFDYNNDSSGQRLDVSLHGSDAVGLHSVDAVAAFDSNNTQPDLYGTYTYQRLRETLGVTVSRTTDPRTKYSYGTETRPVRRERTSVALSLSIPMPGEFHAQSVWFGYALSQLDANLPTGTAADPSATVPHQPFRGFTSSIRFGYQFSNTESYLYSIGAERGFSLALYGERFDSHLGSDLAGSVASLRASTYFPLPTGAHHVLGLRTTLAASEGLAAPGYALGGYQDSALLNSVWNGVAQSRQTLRGYPRSRFQGNHLILLQSEYRFPIGWVDRGLSTLPVFLRGFSGSVGADYGGAFSDISGQKPWQSLRLGFAAELWMHWLLGYTLDLQMAIGYARGTSTGAITGGTTYIVLNSAL